MRRTFATLVVVAALAACRSTEIAGPAPAAVHGKIQGAQTFGEGASVQVYRIDDAGLPTPDPFETVRPDRLGRFTTRVLSPGRYRLVYRSADAPPAIASANVPLDTQVVLRPLVEAGLVQVRAKSSGDSYRCRLTEMKPPDGVPDLREFSCSARDAVLLRGLRRGRWALDLPDLGATTEVEVSGGGDLSELVVDPPPMVVGASMTGEVRRADGAGAPWMVVSARPLGTSGVSAQRWGRFATTDVSGLYRIVGIPPGPTLVRVECREAPARILPAAQVVDIPPTGLVHLGFVVER